MQLREFYGVDLGERYNDLAFLTVFYGKFDWRDESVVLTVLRQWFIGVVACEKVQNFGDDGSFVTHHGLSFGGSTGAAAAGGSTTGPTVVVVVGVAASGVGAVVVVTVGALLLSAAADAPIDVVK